MYSFQKMKAVWINIEMEYFNTDSYSHIDD